MVKLLITMGLSLAAYGAVARPGTVNYTEGQVTVDGQPVASKQLGSTEVAPGQVLQTAQGKAEVLLTPGVFLRLGDQSSLRMVSPSITDTRVELLSGRATLEVDLLEKENRLLVRDGGADVRVDKKGLYAFNASQPSVAVYDGKVTAQVADRSVEVGKGKELTLEPSASLKPQKFDKNETDDLYAWSKLRSEYVAEANASSVQTVVAGNPGWWAGTGWYWNPWYSTWAFVPGAGYFGSPWGFGFYSPAYWYANPPLYFYPRGGRVYSGGGVVRSPAVGRGGIVGRPAPAGGPGVRFGGGMRPGAAMGGGRAHMSGRR
jgi:hypothetical protein